MLENKKNCILYLKAAIFLLMIGCPAIEYLQRQGVPYLSRLSFYCYFFIFCLIRVILILSEKDSYYILTAVLSALIFMLIFRDLSLIINIACALSLALLLLLFMKEKLKPYIYLPPSMILTIMWLQQENVPKYIAVFLLISCIHGLLNLLNKNASYYSFLFLILCLMLLILPSKNEPLQWTLIKKAGLIFEDSIREISYRVQYIFNDFGNSNYSSYSDTGLLSGSVTDLKNEELIINTSPSSPYKYLKGCSFLTFTKKGLTDKISYDKNYNAWFIEYINLLYQNKLDKETVSCFSKVNGMEIEYRYIYTKDLILPENPLFIEHLDTIHDETHKKGFKYQLRYMTIDYASPYYLSLLDKPVEKYADYDSICKYSDSVFDFIMSDYFSREYYDSIISDRYHFINEADKFLDTSMLTDDIKRLTNDITKNCSNDYEKAKTIECYLHQYLYDTDIDLRNSDNYIESFLFYSQKGYCTHFASAMTLMLRACNIPARYCSGYLRPEKAEYKDNNEKYELIYGTYSHAWVELYIKNVGWIRMEPTSCEKTAEEMTWGLKVSNDTSDNKKSNAFYHGPTDVSDNKTPAAITPPPTVSHSEETTNENDKRLYRDIIIKSLSYTGAMILLLLLIIGLYRLLIYIRYIKMTARDKYLYNMQHLFQQLDKISDKNIKKTDNKKIVDTAKTKDNAKTVDTTKSKDNTKTTANAKAVGNAKNEDNSHNNSDMILISYLDLIKDEDERKILQAAINNYYRIRFRLDQPSQKEVAESRALFKSYIHLAQCHI